MIDRIFCLILSVSFIFTIKRIFLLSNAVDNYISSKYENMTGNFNYLTPSKALSIGHKINLNFVKGNCIIIFISPTCPPCHEMLENVFHLFQRKTFPFSVLLLVNSLQNTNINTLMKKYGSFFEIKNISSNEIKQIGVTVFPTLVKVDQVKKINSISNQFKKKFFYEGIR